MYTGESSGWLITLQAIGWECEGIEALDVHISCCFCILYVVLSVLINLYTGESSWWLINLPAIVWECEDIKASDLS